MEIIERAGMVDYKPCTTLVDTSSKLSSDPVSGPTHYHGLAGALHGKISRAPSGLGAPTLKIHMKKFIKILIKNMSG
jgi:hypothetical protein